MTGEKEVQAPRYGGGHDEMDTIDNFETGTLVPIATACLPEVISYDNDGNINKLLYTGFETCFDWDPRHLPGAKYMVKSRFCTMLEKRGAMS